MAIESGSGVADSPTADEELDVTPAADEAVGSDSSTEPTTDSPAVETPEPEVQRKPDSKAEAESALQAAIDHLAGPKPTDEGDEAAGQPSGKAPEKPAAAKPDAKAKPDEKAPDKPDEDPFSDWTPEERASIKAKAANRFKAVYDRARKAETSLQEVEAVITKTEVPREQLERVLSTGKAWNDVLDTYGVRQELAHVDDGQVAGMIRTQAAATRIAAAMSKGQSPAETDLGLLVQLQQNLDGVLDRAGKGRAPVTSIPEFKGDLPAKVKDLVDMELLSAEEARDLAAVLDARAKAKTATPAKTAPAPDATRAAAPAQPARSLAPTPTRSAAPAPAVQAANRLIVRDLTEAGIPAEKVVEHFTGKLMPIIDRMVKEDLGPTAKVDDVEPALRPEYARRAQREFAATRQPKARPASQTPRPARPLEGTKTRTPAAVAAQSDLEHAISFLSSPTPDSTE